MSSGRLPMNAMKAEWMKCPRCKSKRLKPELINTDVHGSTLWWVCENYDNCFFPLDMPAHIYKVLQTPFQKKDGFVPLPKIPQIPEKYRYMYPITFDYSPQSPRFSTNISKANSKNETIDTSDSGSLSDKSSGRNRLRADGVEVQSGVASSSAIASTSDQNEAVGDHENIDEELEVATKIRSKTCRTLPRKRYHDSAKSWAQLIEKVASDPNASEKIINMEESELFLRMKEFFDDKYFKTDPITFKRPARLGTDALNHVFTNGDSRRVTYRVDDVECCLRTVTQDDWEQARKRLPQIPLNTRAALRTAGAETLLKTVGIDLQQIRKAVGEKVGNVMREFSTGNMAKRRKIEENRKVEKKQKDESLKKEIHQSVSARILNRKRRRDDEDRSLTCTPTSSCDFEPATPASASSFDLEPATPCSSSHQLESSSEHRPVQFHLGNVEEEHEDTWGFDLDGLYESIHSQNQVPHEQNLLDPVEAMLFPMNENPAHEEHPADDPALESGDEQPEDEENDQFADFDDFSGLEDSNFDFVNDNFGF